MRQMTTAGSIGLALDPERMDGGAVLSALLGLARQAVQHLPPPPPAPEDGPGFPGPGPGAAVGRLRGTGPGVSFRRWVEALERDYPVRLRYPFEANDRVGGAIWPGTLVEPESKLALMKLRWEAGADDLPMHTHEHSDRCIVVHRGRGFFHVTDETVGGFTGTRVRTIAARERDVFVFRRGTVHTFSTFEEPMELLSCHLPMIPLEDPRQYTLPDRHWTARSEIGVCAGHAVELQGWASLNTAG